MFPSIVLALSTLAVLSLASPIQKRSVNGPVIAANFPDPSIIQVGSSWYSFATNNGVHNVQIATSNDFNTWTVLDQDALPRVGAWSNGQNVWAPDVVQVVRHPENPNANLHDTYITRTLISYSTTQQPTALAKPTA